MTDSTVVPDGRHRSRFALRFELLSSAFVLLLASIVGVLVVTWWIVAVALVPVGVGLLLTGSATVKLRWFADQHRRWAGRRLGTPVPSPDRPELSGSLFRQVIAVLRDPATWGDAARLFGCCLSEVVITSVMITLFGGAIFYLIYPFLYWVTPPEVFGTPFGFFQLHSVQDAFGLVPLGLVFFVLWYVTAEPLADLNARVIVNLLAPTKQELLRARVRQLASSRAETVDTQASELRRIERDLHDGAQARLSSLGMSLGLAEQLLEHDPAAARRLLAEARASTSSALVELRDLVRGIHPPVLADRGLDGALQALALINPVPTTVLISLPGRLPAPVESAAYFAVAEALTNAIKHSGAGHIVITVGHADGQLSMLVSDDGRGGARVDAGSGLRGIERRLAAFDGTLTVDSPAGGPTDVRMSLPCAL